MLDTPCSVGTSGARTYRRVVVNGQMLGRHRVAVAEVDGWDAIEGKVVMHLCDNPPCDNYEHLVIGTKAENSADMVSKGRQYRPPKRTHCRNGHEYVEDNVRMMNDGSRSCRTCERERALAYYHRSQG